MPVPLRVGKESGLEPLMRRVLEGVRQGKVEVDEAWLQAAGLGSYAEFKPRFIALIRTAMRARFVKEGKSDEFGVSFDDKGVQFVRISLAALERSVSFEAP